MAPIRVVHNGEQYVPGHLFKSSSMFAGKYSILNVRIFQVSPVSLWVTYLSIVLEQMLLIFCKSDISDKQNKLHLLFRKQRVFTHEMVACISI